MKKLRILIAEDEPIVRMGLKKMLTDLGHIPLPAVDGHEALQIFHSAAPDMAILDIRMPRTDGLAAAKAMTRKRPIPIIILTAYGEQDFIEQAAALPIQSYLIKPVDERDLSAAIQIAAARFGDAQAQAKANADLQESLESRKVVERAKGVMMSQGLGEEEAYLSLQEKARSRQITMRQAAEEILRPSRS
jgi:two-component system, response regulator PdtaR